MAPSRRRFSIAAQQRRRASGSKPVVGSSRKIRSGSPARARAKSRRRRWPPDSLRTWVFRTSASSTTFEQVAERARVRVVAAPDVDELGYPGLPGEAALLQDHADPLAEPGRLGRRVEAQDADRAAARRPEALQDLQRGGLACAVRAEQAEHFAVADVEVHAAQHLGRAVAHPQVANLDRRGLRYRARSRLICDARVSHYPRLYDAASVIVRDHVSQSVVHAETGEKLRHGPPHASSTRKSAECPGPGRFTQANRFTRAPPEQGREFGGLAGEVGPGRARGPAGSQVGGGRQARWVQPDRRPARTSKRTSTPPAQPSTSKSDG